MPKGQLRSTLTRLSRRLHFDIAIVSSNASLISQLLNAGRANVRQYDTILALAILSICLNVIIGAMLAYAAFQKPEKKKKDENASGGDSVALNDANNGKHHIEESLKRLNGLATFITMLMTITNIILASFASGAGFTVPSPISTPAPNATM